AERPSERRRRGRSAPVWAHTQPAIDAARVSRGNCELSPPYLRETAAASLEAPESRLHIRRNPGQAPARAPRGCLRPEVLSVVARVPSRSGRTGKVSWPVTAREPLAGNATGLGATISTPLVGSLAQ